MKAHAVIGAGWGDEGKGLITDYLANREKANVVVRFNGGAQAGHTVVLPDGKRHVFKHFSSGTFAGASTFLSSHFVCSPILFLQERELLLQTMPTCLHGREMVIDPDALITTPFDMMINQAIESSRGNNRHGSVGVGFGETIERSLEVPLKMFDLHDTAKTNAILQKIQHEWYPARLKKFGLENYSKSDILKPIMKRFERDLEYFYNHIEVKSSRYLRGKKIIFEGAQGLALDQGSENFPYVTRSNTGVKNLFETIYGITEITDLDVYYTSRVYTTKHGAGPLKGELEHRPFSDVVETTNISHAYQGDFRYAYLDATALGKRIRRDVGIERPWGLNVTNKLALTCCDQADLQSKIIVNDEVVTVNREELPSAIADVASRELGLISYGPTRRDVAIYKKQK